MRRPFKPVSASAGGATSEGDIGDVSFDELRMLHDLMLVRRYDGDKVSPGGIIVPDTSVHPSCHGTVLAAGLGLQKVGKNGEDWTLSEEREPMECAVGDTVMYDGSSGINAREYRKGSGIIIVAQRDVLFLARDPEDEFNLQAHEPGGELFARPDSDGYWPVGHHLPAWLRNRIEEAGRGNVQVSAEDERSSGW